MRDAFGLSAGTKAIEPAPQFDPELDLTARVALAGAVLHAMSLSGNFARIVMLAGQGAQVTNNPHENALHFSGHSGDVNARLLASLLNDA